MWAIPLMISTRNPPHHPKKRTGYRGQAMGMSPVFSVGRVRLCQEVWIHIHPRMFCPLPASTTCLPPGLRAS